MGLNLGTLGRWHEGDVLTHAGQSFSRSSRHSNVCCGVSLLALEYISRWSPASGLGASNILLFCNGFPALHFDCHPWHIPSFVLICFQTRLCIRKGQSPWRQPGRMADHPSNIINCECRCLRTHAVWSSRGSPLHYLRQLARHCSAIAKFSL